LFIHSFISSRKHTHSHTRALPPHVAHNRQQACNPHLPVPFRPTLASNPRQIVSRGFPAELHSLHSASPADIEEMAISPEDSAQSSPAVLPARQGRQAQGWHGGVEYVQCVLGGLLGSSCCLLQLGANALASLNVAHIGCTGFNKVLGPVRPQVARTPTLIPG
jgi:hypothetical protein